MKIGKFLICIISILPSTSTEGQITITPEETSLSGITLVTDSETSFLYNPAGLTEGSHLSAGLGLYFAGSGLTAGVLAISRGKGALRVGIGTTFLGDQLYKLGDVITAMAIQSGLLTAGISGRMGFEGFTDQTRTWISELGLGLRLQKNDLVIGASLKRILYESGAKVLYSLGMRFSPLKGFIFLIQSDYRHSLSMKTGMIVNVFSHVRMNYAIDFNQWSQSVGLVYSWDQLEIIISLVRHPYLGLSSFTGINREL